jgi:hypothetical protein
MSEIILSTHLGHFWRCSHRSTVRQDTPNLSAICLRERPEIRERRAVWVDNVFTLSFLTSFAIVVMSSRVFMKLMIFKKFIAMLTTTPPTPEPKHNLFSVHGWTYVVSIKRTVHKAISRFSLCIEFVSGLLGLFFGVIVAKPFLCMDYIDHADAQIPVKLVINLLGFHCPFLLCDC